MPAIVYSLGGVLPLARAISSGSTDVGWVVSGLEVSAFAFKESLMSAFFAESATWAWAVIEFSKQQQMVNKKTQISDLRSIQSVF